jgi:hypothetical protein
MSDRWFRFQPKNHKLGLASHDTGEDRLFDVFLVGMRRTAFVFVQALVDLEAGMSSQRNS